MDAPGQRTAQKDSSAADDGEDGVGGGDGSLGSVPEGGGGVDGHGPETGGLDGATADATSGTADSGEESGALPDSSAQEAGGAIDVCAATSGALAWTASIPPTGSSLALVDIVAGPTDDVIVADTSGGATFEQHRWDSAGTFVSTHQDPVGAYTGTLWTSGLFADAANSVFYGMFLTGLPQGANSGVELVFNALSPAGALVFSATIPGAAPVSSPAPAVTFLQVGGDSSANLHAAFVMANPQSVGQGVYCYDYSGLPEGAGAQNVTSNLTSQDFLWPTPDNDLILFAPISTTTDFGCGSPLAVPAAGGVALVKTDGGGNCMWNKLLALPTAAVLSTNFRVGVDGSLNASVVYSGTIDFGGGPLTSIGSSALAVAKFDSGGDLLWDQSFGGAGSSFGIGSLSANAAGTLVVTSSYAGTVDLGGAPLDASGDTFLAVFDSTGDLEMGQVAHRRCRGQASGRSGSVRPRRSDPGDDGRPRCRGLVADVPRGRGLWSLNCRAVTDFPADSRGISRLRYRV